MGSRSKSYVMVGYKLPATIIDNESQDELDFYDEEFSPYMDGYDNDGISLIIDQMGISDEVAFGKVLAKSSEDDHFHFGLFNMPDVMEAIVSVRKKFIEIFGNTNVSEEDTKVRLFLFTYSS